ncbi:unnamed protein product, partial [Dovyalis caffra]
IYLGLDPHDTLLSNLKPTFIFTPYHGINNDCTSFEVGFRGRQKTRKRSKGDPMTRTTSSYASSKSDCLRFNSHRFIRYYCSLSSFMSLKKPLNDILVTHSWYLLLGLEGTMNCVSHLDWSSVD